MDVDAPATQLLTNYKLYTINGRHQLVNSKSHSVPWPLSVHRKIVLYKIYNKISYETNDEQLPVTDMSSAMTARVYQALYQVTVNTSSYSLMITIMTQQDTFELTE